MTVTFSKLILLLLFVFSFTSQLPAQDTIQISHGCFKETALFSGYILNTGNKGNKSSHILEIGIWKTKYVNHVEPVSASYYLSNEFLLHDSKFAIGPKVGCFVGFWTLCLGIEVVYYTDFEDGAIRLTPFFGLGGHNIKLTINPLISLYNKDFKYINPVSLSLTIQILSLKKQRL
jgi:hypothetical protein